MQRRGKRRIPVSTAVMIKKMVASKNNLSALRLTKSLAKTHRLGLANERSAKMVNGSLKAAALA